MKNNLVVQKSFFFFLFVSEGMADEKRQILVNEGWILTLHSLNSLTKTLNFTLESSKEEEAFDGILLITRSLSTESSYQKDLDEFEELVRNAHGIEGKCVFIWSGSRDESRKENMIKDLRLEERGCVWGFGLWIQRSGKHQIVCDFFEENLSSCPFKPAK